jgi:hypothetical protein
MEDKAQQHSRRLLMHKIVVKILNRQKSLTFQRWNQNVVEKRNMSRIMKKVAGR